MHRLFACLLLILATISLSPSVRAEKKNAAKPAAPTGEGLPNKLLAPGPLIHGHEDLEGGDCLACHTAAKGIPDRKCLACHKDIQASIDRRRGFHATAKATCVGCHRDHLGRTFNAVAVDQKAFDHAKTGLALKGGHHGLACTKCHTQTRTGKATRPREPRFLTVATSCAGCHASADPHHFSGKWATKDCGGCHTDTTWKGGTFDHRWETAFPLLGQHAEVKCEACHNPKGEPAKYRFPELPAKACLTCHQDFHGQNLDAPYRGGACDRCHSLKTWKLQGFDHRRTNFLLRGSHAKARCVDCHVQKAGDQGLAAFDFGHLTRECASCHADFHGYGAAVAPKVGPLAACATCHSEKTWKDDLRFDHNTQTTYPLDGKHAGVPCFACHKPVKVNGTVVAGAVVANVPRLYKLPDLAQKSCEACHKSPHTEAQAPIFKTEACTSCHNTTSWSARPPTAPPFDHDKMTRFPLESGHKRLTCNQCHGRDGARTYRFADAEAGFCSSCHRTVHAEQFDADFLKLGCNTCHTSERWDQQRPFDHDLTKFKLRGAHQQKAATCAACHPKTSHRFPPPAAHQKSRFVFGDLAAKDCALCHKDPHQARFGPQCSQCHTDKAWSETKDFHRAFTLAGVHTQLDCADCHVRGRKLTGLGTDCRSCHQKDDIHRGTLPTCAECHGQMGWRPSTFRHGLTDFPLRGAHRLLECAACHAQGVYQGKNSDCVSCHERDAARVKQPNHKLPGFTECDRCHNQFMFNGATK